jgi:hypothetical protein
MNNIKNQSFNVDDIRQIREEADIKYQNMTPDEISSYIHEGAKEGYKIIEQILHEKSKQQGA